MAVFSLRILRFGLVGCSFAFVCGLSAAVSALDREIVLAPHSGVTPEDREIVQWQERAEHSGAPRAAFERLGWAFVAKARRTLDAGFYKLAEKTADVIDAEFGANADSRLLRAHVLHNLHRFQEAEAIARSLVAERALPADLALLSDCLMEQGKLDECTGVLQRLLDLNPGVVASSRVAHVRWLKGDLAGAIAALESAIAASSARDFETRAWLLSRLSGMYLQIGDSAGALELAHNAEARLADYPPALLARGRALLALNRTGEAITALEQAERLQPLPEYQWWLADALSLAGRADDARAVERRLHAHGAENDPRTYALFLATRGGEVQRAVRLSRLELAARADVLSHDAAAWSLCAAGDIAGADFEIRLALAAGTKDARLFLHAGRIALQGGDGARAAGYFAEAETFSATLTPSERTALAAHLSAE